MPLAHQRVQEVAATGKKVAESIKLAYQQAAAFLATNADLAIDWPNYADVDGNGNLTGTLFTPTDVSNLVGSVEQFRRLIANETVTEGDHLGNINKVADVEVTES